ISMIESEFSLPLLIKLLPALLSLFGAILAIYLYHINPEFIISLTNNNLGRQIYTFLNNKYFFDVIYNKFFIEKGLKLGYIISKILDRGVIELVGPYGISSALDKTALSISMSDTKVISTYSTYIILNVLFLIFIFFFFLLINIFFFKIILFFRKI